jgi:hypothetical protein
MPAARVVVLKVATPLAFSCAEPRLVDPSRKVTVPVATVLPVCGETVAVKVTLWSGLMVAAEAVSTVFVTERPVAMVTVTASEVEAVSLESPP